MDDIQANLEERQRELRNALDRTDDAVRQTELQLEIFALDERLARMG